MKWSEIKKWAKTKGYNVSRKKAEDADECTYVYNWNNEDRDANGVATSTKDLATDIYNHLTNNKHLPHQLQYKTEFRWFKNEN
jgi:hypothetical protein